MFSISNDKLLINTGYNHPGQDIQSQRYTADPRLQDPRYMDPRYYLNTRYTSIDPR